MVDILDPTAPAKRGAQDMRPNLTVIETESFSG